MKWIKDRLGWIVSFLTGLVSLGAIGFFLRKKFLASEKRAELAEATSRARVLEERRRHLKTLVDQDDAAIEKIEGKIQEVRRRAVSVISKVDGMTDDEVLRRFKQLGY